MKTAYKVRRGHVYHVIHETKTAKTSSGAVWTLCGSFYEDGDRGHQTPTCPGCLKTDNPLLLSSTSMVWLEAIAHGEELSMAVRAAREQLIRHDYVDPDGSLTRRGKIVTQDFHSGSVPMADEAGIVHARKPLNIYPACERNGRLLFVNEMTTERYGKLRLVEDQIIVTCLQCISKDGTGHHDYVH